MGNYEIMWQQLKHRGGTKEYTVILIINRDTSMGMFINKWGKVGTDGQHLVQMGHVTETTQRYTEKIREKTGSRGYGRTGMLGPKVTDFAEVEGTLKGFKVWHKIAPSDLNRLMDLSDPALKDFIDEVAPEAPVAPKHTYADNPKWGIF